MASVSGLQIQNRHSARRSVGVFARPCLVLTTTGTLASRADSVLLINGNDFKSRTLSDFAKGPYFAKCNKAYNVSTLF